MSSDNHLIIGLLCLILMYLSTSFATGWAIAALCNFVMFLIAVIREEVRND